MNELSKEDNDETHSWNPTKSWFFNFPHHKYVVYSCKKTINIKENEMGETKITSIIMLSKQ